MKCKTKWCGRESGHNGRCLRLTDAINIAEVAINRSTEAAESRTSLGRVERLAGAPEREHTKLASTPNRRKREDYNAYMKRYMKARRAKPLGIAYG